MRLHGCDASAADDGDEETATPPQLQPQPTPPPPPATDTHYAWQNLWFTSNVTHGHFMWFEALTFPALCDRSDQCASLEVPAFTFAWCVVVLSVLVPIAARETIDRVHRYQQCRVEESASASASAANATDVAVAVAVAAPPTPCVPVSPWLFDFGHWSLMWMFVYFACRMAMILQYRDASPPERRALRTAQPTPLARLAWFAHVNGIPGTIVASIMYAVFLRSSELHGPLTDASYALNAIFAAIDVWFFRMVLLHVHVAWIVLSGALYAALMLPRSYHRPEELLVACLLLVVVYSTIADFSMMRDSYYRHHVFVRVRR